QAPSSPPPPRAPSRKRHRAIDGPGGAHYDGASSDDSRNPFSKTPSRPLRRSISRQRRKADLRKPVSPPCCDNERREADEEAWFPVGEKPHDGQRKSIHAPGVFHQRQRCGFVTFRSIARSGKDESGMRQTSLNNWPLTSEVEGR